MFVRVAARYKDGANLRGSLDNKRAGVSVAEWRNLDRTAYRNLLVANWNSWWRESGCRELGVGGDLEGRVLVI